MKKNNTKKARSGSTTALLDDLIQKLKHHEFNRYLIVVSKNQGIATDELSQFIKSNNHHNATQYLNEIIIPHGWVIAKFHAGNPSKSWRWYVMPVKQALTQGIRKSLRNKIFQLLRSANDE